MSDPKITPFTPDELAKVQRIAATDYEVRHLFKAYQSGAISDEGYALLREECGLNS
jgi:hypothetical protein